MNDRSANRPPGLLDYLRLFRLPNVFTAIADVLMGFTVADPSWKQIAALPWLIAASVCLYTAGMVWNDVFDLEIDRRERPRRPLPAGRIPLSTARWLGVAMLVAGPLLAGIASQFASPDVHSRWLAPAVASLLVVLVLGYDGGLKHTLLGPWAMGGCRVANVLLGMSLANGAYAGAKPGGVLQLGWTGEMWWIAAAIGVYIAGVTLFAKQEAGQSHRVGLVSGLAVMFCGLLMLTAIHWIAGAERAASFRLSPAWWVFLVVALGMTIVRRGLAAVREPSPAQVQQSVKFAILSLISLDAALALLASVSPWPALSIAALIAPALLLGRWVYST